MRKDHSLELPPDPCIHSSTKLVFILGGGEEWSGVEEGGGRVARCSRHGGGGGGDRSPGQADNGSHGAAQRTNQRPRETQSLR